MDPSLPNLDYTLFQTDPEEFKEYYRDADQHTVYFQSKDPHRNLTNI